MTSRSTPPTVLVVFDPESGVTVLSDDDVDTIIVDLGGPLDFEHLSPQNYPEVTEYVAGWLQRARTLPETSVIRSNLEAICDSVLIRVGSNLKEYLASHASIIE